MIRSIQELETPVALVDVERMEANLSRVAHYCGRHGLAWRPHVKTHKTPELAAMQIAAGAVGLSVATLGEGEVMASVADDILLAYPPIGAAKLRRLAALAERVNLTVGLDSAEALRGVAGAAREAGRTIGIFIEIDVGMHRVGVQSPAAAAELAMEAESLDGVEYRGIMAYPGHIREHVDAQDEAIARLAGDFQEMVSELDARGVRPDVVSGGSTPTLWHSHRIPTLTEIRPGTNIFNDRTTAAIGACDWQECAYSVLATVVSTSVPGQAVIDAGAKALAKEELRGEGRGYGALLDRPEIVVRAVSEEHGMLDLSGTDWRPRVGDFVRVVPNHVCVSVNLQERLYGVQGDRIVETWEIAGRRRGASVA